MKATTRDGRVVLEMSADRAARLAEILDDADDPVFVAYGQIIERAASANIVTPFLSNGS